MEPQPFDRRFMEEALAEARLAGESGEVPVGAVVAIGDEIVGRGRNGPIGAVDPTAHAELRAVRDAAARVGNYRLNGATLYSTVEPCLMCLGAALHARIDRLVYGARDPKVGTTRVVEDLRRGGAGFNHRFEVTGGVLEGEARELLEAFFRARRGDDPPEEGPGTAG